MSTCRHCRIATVLLPLLLLPGLVPGNGALPAQTLGVDVSHHSGAVDWNRVVEDGYDFAYVKATEGVDDADPRFEEHWASLHDHPIERGAYHFYVTEDPPEEQARFFLSRVHHEPGDLPPMVDVEVLGHDTTGDLVARLHRYLAIVEEAVGMRPIIYTNARFWNAHLDDSFGAYPLWIAEYGVAAPQLPDGWSSWLLWQFQGDAPVAGIAKGADRSRLHAEADLETLARPASPPGGGGR